MKSNIKSFNTDSDKYFSNRPTYPSEIYTYISSNCSEHNIAWDCACGNGQVAIDLINYFNKVKATDISENQIENSYTHEMIHYSVQDSEKTNFPDSYFDVICVAEALHWFNLDKFFDEAKRTLKSNGLFTCWGYGFFRIDNKIDEIILRILIPEIAPYISEGNLMLINKYKSIEFPFKKMEYPSFKMNCHWTLGQLIDYILTWSPVKIYISKFGLSLIEELKNQLRIHWKNDEVKEIKMDFIFYAGKC